MGKSSVGYVIKKGRLEKNYTQEGLAQRLGVSSITVSRWERGLMYPDATHRSLLAKQLSHRRRTYQPQDFAA